MPRYEVRELTRRFGGAYNLVQLRVGDAIIKARVPSRQRFKEGETVRARFDPTGCRLFNTSTGKALDWVTNEVTLAPV